MSWLLALALAAVPVSVQVDPCLGVAPAEVQRLAALELMTATATTQPVRARLTCEGDAVRFEVDDPVTKTRLTRTEALDGVAPKARGRVVALALAELLQGAWSEAALAAAKVVAPPAPVPAAVAPRATVQLEAQVVARRLLVAGLWQLGGGGRVAVLGEHFGGALLFDAAHAQASFALGAVSVDSYAAAALAVWAPGSVGPLSAQVGVGARAGVGVITGAPTDPEANRGSSFSGAWLGPCMAARGTVALGHFTVSLDGELGSAMVGVRGVVAGVAGPGVVGGWYSLALGLGGRW